MAEEGVLRDDTIRKILADTHFVSGEDLAKAETAAKRSRQPLFEVLVSTGVLNEDLLGQAVAESLGVHYADLNSRPPSPEQVLRIPEDVARAARMVVFEEKEKTIVLATDTPSNGIPAAVKKLFSKQKIELRFALPQDIDFAFRAYRKTLDTRFAAIIAEGRRLAPDIIAQIFEDALLHRASDIHFEPQETGVVIRFRVDGILHDAGTVGREYYENILNRLKVMAQLRIDQHLAAQDGGIRATVGTRVVDMRMSVVPILEGEKVVLRILAQYVKGFGLDDLGYRDGDRQLLADAAKKPFGMILVSGPTGSGKTTTLYAVLKTLHRPEVNIMTIEDPVEIRIAGVNQIQVNTQADLTFAKGLRSIVRQDPNIILVGEVRDRETAEIAVNAALTGHLLLSTFHANDAATAIPRLLDMGVEPFLLSSTLNILVAQRLARRLCENCRHSATLSAADIARMSTVAAGWFPKGMRAYEAKGCAACNNTGYAGRIALVEMIRVTKEMQDLILRRPSSLDVWRLAREQGARSMFEDGLEKVKIGFTSLDELLRVASPGEGASAKRSGARGRAAP